ncbi:MAG: hypothetical protein KKH04_22290 [Proteobacteria bacterium]|nr:hypothetical protein [Pseudomonadota bacterium]
MEQILLESERLSSAAQKWPEDFVEDVALRTAFFSGNTAKRHLSIFKNLEVGTFSSKASAHSFKLENFGLQVINAANYTYAYIIQHDALTHLGSAPVHSTGENNWIVPTWESSKIPALQKYINQLWTKIERIMKLPSNWDSYGAVKISTGTIANALEVLIEAYEAQKQIGYEPLIPFIAPCADGSIQLEWENNNKELEARVVPPPLEEKIFLLRVLKKEKDYQEDTIESPTEIVHYISWLRKNE